jgi:hypothetical protein
LASQAGGRGFESRFPLQKIRRSGRQSTLASIPEKLSVLKKNEFLRGTGVIMAWPRPEFEGIASAIPAARQAEGKRR